MAVRTTTVFILLARMVTYAVGAEDTIKSGNWEYSATAPRITQLPPGMQPSPDIRFGPEGLTLRQNEMHYSGRSNSAYARCRRTLQDGQD